MPAPLGRMLGSAPDVSLAVSLTLAWDPAPLVHRGSSEGVRWPWAQSPAFPGTLGGRLPHLGPPRVF